jgi:hypothetical protein
MYPEIYSRIEAGIPAAPVEEVAAVEPAEDGEGQ